MLHKGAKQVAFSGYLSTEGLAVSPMKYRLIFNEAVEGHSDMYVPATDLGFIEPANAGRMEISKAEDKFMKKFFGAVKGAVAVTNEDNYAFLTVVKIQKAQSPRRA